MKEKKTILKYMIPGIVGLLFNSLYIIVDGIFVSKMLGSSALAAVTLVVPIVELIIAMSLMISIGGGFYISYYKGKQKDSESREYFNQGFLAMMALSIVFTIGLLVFKNPIIGLLGTSIELRALTSEYYFWFVVFIPFFMMNYALGTWIRNDNKPELAMMTQVVSAIINVVLDYVFMGPLNMGIKGAAIATGLGPVFGILMLAPHFLRKKGDLYFEAITPSINKIKKIVFAGLPSFTIEFSLGVTTFLCNIFIVKIYGEIGIAAFGVIGYINLIVLSIFLGIGQGTQPIISKLEGENKQYEIFDISKFLLAFSILIGIAAYALLVVFKANLLPLFVDRTDAELIALTSKAINMFFITLAITGINITTASLFEAKHEVKSSISISLLRSAFFLYPALLMMSTYKSGQLIWYAVPIAEIATVFASVYLWYKLIAKDYILKKKSPLKRVTRQRT